MSDADIKLPTEPAAPDPARLQSIVETIRAQYHDPDSIYANRPDLVESSETRLKALMIRAGIDDKPLTPQALAARQQAEHWDVKENPAFNEMMASRKAELQQLGDDKLEARAAELRRDLGSQYFTLLEQAKAGLELWGETIPLAVQADLGLLRVAAAKGQFKAAKQRNSKF